MTARTLRAACVTSVDRLRTRADFTAHSPDIFSVSTDGDLSTWKLAFRSTFVCWTQREELQGSRLTFEQVAGDFIHLRGSWNVANREVTYNVDYSTSVAHLAGAVDPVIGRVLLRVASAILTAVAGPIELVEGAETLYDISMRTFPRSAE